MSCPRHLLVDGANILHAWPETRQLLGRNREAARARLAQQLTAIHDLDGTRVTLVFDGRGPEIAVERPSNHPTFSVIHAPASLTADDVIEQIVANSGDPAACLVATDDRAQQQTVTASGAATMSAAELAAWVLRAEAQQARTARRIEAVNEREWRRP